LRAMRPSDPPAPEPPSMRTRCRPRSRRTRQRGSARRARVSARTAEQSKPLALGETPPRRAVLRHGSRPVSRLCAGRWRRSDHLGVAGRSQRRRHRRRVADRRRRLASTAPCRFAPRAPRSHARAPPARTAAACTREGWSSGAIRFAEAHRKPPVRAGGERAQGRDDPQPARHPFLGRRTCDQHHCVGLIAWHHDQRRLPSCLSFVAASAQCRPQQATQC